MIEYRELNVIERVRIRPCIDTVKAASAKWISLMYSLYRLGGETGVTEILTLDVVDFSRYRIPQGKAFVLL